MPGTAGKMRRLPADAWIALAMLAVCGFLLHNLLTVESSGTFVSTTTMPTALVVCLAVLSFILLGGALLRPAAETSRTADTNGRGIVRVVALAVWIVLYTAALPWLGYYASTTAFLLGAGVLFGNRRPLLVVAVAALIPLALLLFFEKIMLVLLPTASLFH
jgi:hypothetical protein